MRLLVDTHAFVWWLADDIRLSPAAFAAIADPANELHVSAASAWEIGVKVALGRLDVPALHDVPLEEVAREERMEPIPVVFGDALAAALLPLLHRDPFDRMLIAQAQARGMAIVTGDRQIARYAVATIW